MPFRRLLLGIISFPVIHTASIQLQLRGAEIPPLISVKLEKVHLFTFSIHLIKMICCKHLACNLKILLIWLKK